MKFTLRGARLVDAVTDLPAGDLVVDDGVIRAIASAADAADAAGADGHGAIIDAAGMIVVPGFIDVHTHGGGGHNLHTTDADEIRAYARWAPQTGVTAFLVGVVGTPDGPPLAQLGAAADAVERHDVGAEPLGIHLEGPYISEQRRGAHLPAWLRVPSAAETADVLEASRRHLRIVTIAPELPGAAEMIGRLVEADVTVSIGHTDATYEQARDAIVRGATHATHCCNAMRPLHHRDPGPLGAIADARTVRGEVIVDGVHVHPAMVHLLVRMLGPERTVVITDALAGAGVPDASFEFAGQQANVVCGVARLSDGTITGSVLTMDQALRNVLEMAGVSLREAVGMLTYNPAQAAGAANRKGRLAPGYEADLVILDRDLGVLATLCRGSVAHATRDWRRRLGAAATVASR